MRATKISTLGMTRRRFLVGSNYVLAAMGLKGCASGPAPRTEPPYPGLRDQMATQVAQQQFPGAVWLLARGMRVAVEAVGITAIDSSMPMRRDTIFRIASMTKPVTATAVMMLIEEGKLALDAPVERWLPELAHRTVLRRIDGPLDDTEPAAAPSPCTTCSPSRSASASCSTTRRRSSGRSTSCSS